MITESIYEKACDAINQVHVKDLNTEIVDGVTLASELVYSRLMLKVLQEYLPDADYTMKLAAQCQHFERWAVARSLFPMDKKGYYQWRKAIMDYQLKRTKEVLTLCEINPTEIDEICDILVNRGIKEHAKGQEMEDVACIVFVEYYLQAFAAKHDPEKVIDIVKKTVKKISEKGMHAISGRSLSAPVQDILKQL